MYMYVYMYMYVSLSLSIYIYISQLLLLGMESSRVATIWVRILREISKRLGSFLVKAAA